VRNCIYYFLESVLWWITSRFCEFGPKESSERINEYFDYSGISLVVPCVLHNALDMSRSVFNLICQRADMKSRRSIEYYE
jgi:hypothetical protein